ncbi:uncharacterized [Tachysurus ichikawai]
MLWVVNLQKTCAPSSSGTCCEVSSTTYPIHHIYRAHHSGSLVLAADSSRETKSGLSSRVIVMTPLCNSELSFFLSFFITPSLLLGVTPRRST